MKNTIKYNMTVAIVIIATVFSACGTDKDTIVPIEQYEVAQGKDNVPDIDGIDNTEAQTISSEVDYNDKTEEVRVIESDSIYVYVCGAVVNSDVYELSGGARIVDALRAAGGCIPEAGIEYMNLASRLHDGQKIYVPTTDEIEEAIESGEIISDSVVNISPIINQTDYISDSNQDDVSKEDTNSKSSQINNQTVNGKVNINTADAGTLMSIPGIGQSKADKIIAYRDDNGGFTCIEDIMLVGGIKDGMFNKIKEYICVE